MFRKKQSQDVARQRQPTVVRQKAAVFSYHANRAISPINAGGRRAAPQFPAGAAAERRHTPVNWLKRGPLLAGLLVLAALLVGNLFVTATPRMETTGDSRGAVFLRSPNTYADAARSALASSIFNRTKPTIDTDRLSKQLASQFPELAQVHVVIPLIGRQPIISLEPAVPTALLAAADGQVYVLDATGRALITANKAPAVAKLGLPLVSDQSGLPVTLGKVVVPSSTINYITEITGQLKAQKLSIETLRLPKGASELDVQVSGAPYIIKCNLQGDARAEAGTYLAVKQYLDADHKTPTAYIDVRVDGRAYYK